MLITTFNAKHFLLCTTTAPVTNTPKPHLKRVATGSTATLGNLRLHLNGHGRLGPGPLTLLELKL
jgi:hypothetical protein